MDNQNQPVPSQPTPETPVKDSGYGKGNWVKWALVYLLIAVIVYGAIYVLFLSKQGLNPYSAAPTSTPQPTSIQDEAANWKTYINTELGISFKYPNGWNIYTPNSYFRLEIAPEDYRGNGSVLFLTYEDNPNSLSLKDFEEKNTGQSGIGPGYYSPDNKLVTTPIGVTAYYSESVTCEPTGCHSYIIPYKKRIFTLRSNVQEAVPNQKEILDQILSTFKFTDQEQMKIISEGKTSPDGSFSFTQETVGDSQSIIVKDKNGNIITSDLIAAISSVVDRNMRRLGLNGAGQVGYQIKGWVDNSSFVLQILVADGSEFETVVDAKTGSLIESTFKKIK